MGQPVRRGEDQRFLTGQGRYTDDISVPGQAHGVVLRSPLSPGENALPLTLVARSGRGGQLAARLRQRDEQKTFVVDVTIASQSPGVMIREHYLVPDDDHFIYRLDVSNDGGTSWIETQMEMTLRRAE